MLTSVTWPPTARHGFASGSPARTGRPGDWSIELPAGGCTCDLYDTLRAFLATPGRTMFEWPLAQRRR
jgi:hypothetical protein